MEALEARDVQRRLLLRRGDRVVDARLEQRRAQLRVAGRRGCMQRRGPGRLDASPRRLSAPGGGWGGGGASLSCRATKKRSFFAAPSLTTRDIDIESK